jgi:hypothetical protein
MNIRVGAIFLGCLFGIHAGSEACGQDKFYTVIFGVQDGPNRFREAHSFATFVRVSGKPVKIVDQATISWLPASGVVDLRNRPERGTNHPLKKSLEIVTRAQTIAQWGPFEIKEELFERAKKQDQFLRGGGILYKAVDVATRPAGVAVNCEHSISDIVRKPGDPYVKTGTARGHWGSFLVAEHLRSWMIEPTVVHDWLNGPLGLDAYPIAKKGWSWPN